MDESSVTFYYNEGAFGVCSRNLELLESEDNTLWKIARLLDIENKLIALNRNIALQGEVIGEGVQGNPYKLRGQTVKFFNIYDIDRHEYLPFEAFIDHMIELDLKTVPVLETAYTLPDTLENILLAADGTSRLSPLGKKVEREGLVIRSLDRKISFKVISNAFLLSRKES